MNIIDIVKTEKLFLTFLRAQRSVETFRTREMTARTSSFSLKQKENPISKKRPSISTKTSFSEACGEEEKYLDLLKVRSK